MRLVRQGGRRRDAGKSENTTFFWFISPKEQGKHPHQENEQCFPRDWSALRSFQPCCGEGNPGVLRGNQRKEMKTVMVIRTAVPLKAVWPWDRLNFLLSTTRKTSNKRWRGGKASDEKITVTNVSKKANK